MALDQARPPSGSSHHALTAEVDELRRALESQAAVVAAQALVIEQLTERLDRIEDDPGDGAAATDGASTSAPVGLGAATTRRNLMTKGAAAAATAVIGTAAVGLATASPAAAAAGAFTGSPAVTATGTGVVGVTRGVLGTSASPEGGIGVEGKNLASTGEAFGVRGEISTAGYGAAVHGEATGATGETFGVRGVSMSSADGAAALFGRADSPTGPTSGVLGLAASPDGTGVAARADTGIGLKAVSNKTQLLLTGNPVAPQIAGKARIKGEMVFDTNADLWLCTTSGTPGLWRKIMGRSAAGSFHILTSTVRIYDSRAGLNPTGVTKGQIGNFATRTIDAKIGDAIPAGATAVLVNLTIVNTGEPGYLGLYQNGITWPGNSTINWNQPGTLLANSAICALDDQARFAVKANAGFTDFVIDAIGYYR
jgi:hypothetical protein